MLVNELVQDAYRLAEIIAERGESIDSTQLSTGIRLLNYVISRININADEVSLVTTEEVTLTSGNNTVTLDGWVEILKAQYLMGSLWLDTELVNIFTYRNDARITNNSGIPFLGYEQRTATGITISLFFTPDDSYTFRIDGYKSLQSLAINDDIATKDPFYEQLLLYFLAKEIRKYSQLPDSDYLNDICDDISNRLTDIKQDNNKVKLSNVGGGGGRDLQSLNLGQGWTPYNG